MRANQSDIEDYQFRPAVINITYSTAYMQEQARIEAGISLHEWQNLPGDPAWKIFYNAPLCKAEVIMLYRLKHLIPAVVDDVQNRRLEAKLKRHGK